MVAGDSACSRFELRVADRSSEDVVGNDADRVLAAATFRSSSSAGPEKDQHMCRSTPCQDGLKCLPCHSVLLAADP